MWRPVSTSLLFGVIFAIHQGGGNAMDGIYAPDISGLAQPCNPRVEYGHVCWLEDLLTKFRQPRTKSHDKWASGAGIVAIVTETDETKAQTASPGMKDPGAVMLPHEPGVVRRWPQEISDCREMTFVDWSRVTLALAKPCLTAGFGKGATEEEKEEEEEGIDLDDTTRPEVAELLVACGAQERAAAGSGTSTNIDRAFNLERTSKIHFCTFIIVAGALTFTLISACQRRKALRKRRKEEKKKKKKRARKRTKTGTSKGKEKKKKRYERALRLRQQRAILLGYTCMYRKEQIVPSRVHINNRKFLRRWFHHVTNGYSEAIYPTC